jgi:hypothetical protein
VSVGSGMMVVSAKAGEATSAKRANTARAVRVTA